MKYFYKKDDNGRVLEVGFIDGPNDPPADSIVCDSETFNIINSSPMRLVYISPDGQLHFPQDDIKAWKMLRQGADSGQEAFQELERVRQTRKRIRNDIPFVPETGFKITPDFPIHNFSDVQGLVLREMDWSLIQKAAELNVESGIETPTCPPDSNCGCEPPEAHPWLMMAARLDSWNKYQLVLEFNSSPLQLEIIQQIHDNPVIEYTVHFTRERPHWFWRECERPIFELFKKKGFEYIHSRARKDRPDWVNSLIKNYNATITAEYEKVYLMKFPLDLSIFKGWPERKTLGPEWQWRSGSYTVEEASITGLADIIQSSWGTHPRGTLALRMLYEWWNLDRATLLVAKKNDVIVDIRAIRHRKDDLCATGFLTPRKLLTVEDTRAIAPGMLLWQKAAGYNRTSLFLEKAIYEQGRVPSGDFTDFGYQIVRERNDFRIPQVELEANIDDVLSKL